MPIHWGSLSIETADGKWHKLSRQQFLALRCLYEADGGLVTKRELAAALATDDPEGGPLNMECVVRVVLHRLQKYLKGSGWFIDCEYRRGLRLLTQEMLDDLPRRRARERDGQAAAAG